ncbi:MAG TPA: hypothetical protein PK420_15755 [Rubrivivax sp.]|nr:hypothetical protein [Rubrivivax sp.]
MTTSLNTLSLQTRSASIALALAMAAGTCLAQDGAAASFERMLAHQPATHQPVTAAQRDTDPLVAALVVPLRDGIRRQPAAGRRRERPARGVLRAAVRAPAECDRARAAERQRHRPARRRAD